MFNALKRKISDSCYAANVAIILLVLIGGGLTWYTFAQASISSFTIAPTVDGTDNVAGYEGDYDVSYQTDSTGIVTVITLGFPDDYTFNPSMAHDPSALIQSLDETAGNISINGTSFQVATVTPDGQDLVITLAEPFDYNSTPGASDTVAFRLLSQVVNTTVARDVDANEYTVFDDATSNESEIASTGITIIPGPAFTLDFTTLPSVMFPPPGGDVQSGLQWEVQPVVTAHDRYGNVATGYNDSVMLSLGSGDGVFVPATAFSFCSGPAGSYVASAVNGVIDFTPAGATYVATVDNEQFTLLATHLCGSDGDNIGAPGESSVLTADVVATTYVWTQEPADCTSGSACATQGLVTAQDTVTVELTPYTATDLDFTAEVGLGTDGDGTFLGDELQSGWVNGVLTTVGLGYTLVDPAVPEEVYFFIEGSRIGPIFTNGTTVAIAPVTPPPPPPTPPSPSPANRPGASVYNPNPAEIPGGEIAVAPTTPSTSTPSSSPSSGSGVSSDGGCAPYLTAYMRFGDRNDQVTRLQTFLFKEGSYLEGFITGFFGTLTEKAVNIFQQKYAAEILTAQGLSDPTGFAKDYTTRTINRLVCSGAVQL